MSLYSLVSFFFATTNNICIWALNNFNKNVNIYINKKKRCEGKPSCNYKITTSLFKYDPCPGIDKVLEINYFCVLQKRFKYQKGTLIYMNLLPKKYNKKQKTYS